MKKFLAAVSLVSVLFLFAFSPNSGFGQGVPFPEVGKPNPVPGGPAFGPLDVPAAAPKQPQPPAHPAAPNPPVAAAPYGGVGVDGAARPSRARGPERRLPETRSIPTDSLVSVVDRNHPFAFYYGVPTDPRSMIKGKPYRVAKLLEGSRNVTTRKKLLQNYWELAGLLVRYNIRMDAERHLDQWLGKSGNDPQRPNPMNLAYQLAQQQRKSTEIEFVKSQWKLASLLRQIKGETFSEGELPIPCDFPLYKKYETYVDKIARSERARYYGNLIPHQEELISAKSVACKAADNLLQTLPKDVMANSREMVLALNQRTDVFLELVDSVVEYNGMIAEYTSETVGPGVSPYRLVGALIELPNFVPQKSDAPEQTQPQQLAAPTPSHFGYNEPQVEQQDETPTPRPESSRPRYASKGPARPQPTFAPEPTPMSAENPVGLTELPAPMAAPSPAFAETMPPRPEIQPVSHLEEKRESEPAPFHAVAPPAPPVGL